MSEHEGVDLEAQLRRVQGLLAKADATENEHEAATFRAEAERRMKKYRIDESMAAERGEVKLVPISREIPVCLYSSPFSSTYISLGSATAWHVGAQGVFTYKSIDGHPTMVLVLVGYESDIRIAESLYTAARTYFAARMEPQVDPKLSDAENVYSLRRAGITRVRIAQLLGWDTTPNGTDGNAHGRVAKLYKAECERRGEQAAVTGRTFSRKTYREAFVEEFVSTYSNRLWAARNAAAGDYTGGAVVLANRKDSVDEAFYELYPQFRPSKDPAVPVELTDAERKAQAKERERAAKRDLDRMMRLMSPSGRAGSSAGAQAAEEVEIQTSARGRIQG